MRRAWRGREKCVGYERTSAGAKGHERGFGLSLAVVGIWKPSLVVPALYLTSSWTRLFIYLHVKYCLSLNMQGMDHDGLELVPTADIMHRYLYSCASVIHTYGKY